MRSRIGRITRDIAATGQLGTIDWGSILNTVVEAAPAVISSVTSTTSPSYPTVYSAYPAPQPTATTTIQKQSDNTGLYIGLGVLGLGVMGYVLMNNKNKK